MKIKKKNSYSFIPIVVKRSVVKSINFKMNENSLSSDSSVRSDYSRKPIVASMNDDKKKVRIQHIQ